MLRLILLSLLNLKEGCHFCAQSCPHLLVGRVSVEGEVLVFYHSLHESSKLTRHAVECIVEIRSGCISLITSAECFVF